MKIAKTQSITCRIVSEDAKAGTAKSVATKKSISPLSIVRTEPSALSATPEGKKKVYISAIKLQCCLTSKDLKVRKVRRAGARQNCSGDSRASSSLQSLQCMLKAPRRQAVSAKPQATHPPSGLAAESPHHNRTVRTMFADFAARGRSGLNSRELNWTAPVKLAAVQSMAPSGFLTPHYQTNNHKNKDLNKRGREEVTPKGRE